MPILSGGGLVRFWPVHSHKVISVLHLDLQMGQARNRNPMPKSVNGPANVIADPESEGKHLRDEQQLTLT